MLSDRYNILCNLSALTDNVIGPLPVTLTNFSGPSTAYVLTPTTIDGYSYSGAGTITISKATLNLTETGSAGTAIYTFANFLK